MLDGLAWIFYYQSIVHGPISIVGTLSAAYPALTLIFARAFLDEVLGASQFAGVVAVIIGCLALAYTPPDAQRASDTAALDGLRGSRDPDLGRLRDLDPLRVPFPGRPRGEHGAFHRDRRSRDPGRLRTALRPPGAGREWGRSLGPMATMAAGSLLAAIAYKRGPASIVTPLSGAYPVVTLSFAWALLRERPSLVPVGRHRARPARHGADDGRRGILSEASVGYFFVRKVMLVKYPCGA